MIMDCCPNDNVLLSRWWWIAIQMITDCCPGVGFLVNITMYCCCPSWPVFEILKTLWGAVNDWVHCDFGSYCWRSLSLFYQMIIRFIWFLRGSFQIFMLSGEPICWMITGSRVLVWSHSAWVSSLRNRIVISRFFQRPQKRVMGTSSFTGAESKQNR